MPFPFCKGYFLIYDEEMAMKRSNTVDGVSVDSFAVHLAIKSGEVMTLTVLKREFNADTSTNF